MLAYVSIGKMISIFDPSVMVKEQGREGLKIYIYR